MLFEYANCILPNQQHVIPMEETAQPHTAKHDQSTALKIAVAAIFAALVAVATAVFWIPIPATSGYFNLGDTLIYVAALLFGPFVGAVAGAGASVADLFAAPVFAPGTLVIKAIEGFLVGAINRQLYRKTKRFALSASIAVVIGGLEMVLGYFLYETLALGYPVVLALAEVPFNLVQMFVGLVIAVPVTIAVLRVFPQLKSYL
jgi:uncharacterized membrane protein